MMHCLVLKPVIIHDCQILEFLGLEKRVLPGGFTHLGRIVHASVP